MVHFFPTKIEDFVFSIFRELFQVALISGVMAVLLPFSAAATQVPPDPFYGLEDIEGEGSMTWVRGQNQKTTDVLESDRLSLNFRRHKGHFVCRGPGAIFLLSQRIFLEFLAGRSAQAWGDSSNKSGRI